MAGFNLTTQRAVNFVILGLQLLLGIGANLLPFTFYLQLKRVFLDLDFLGFLLSVGFFGFRCSRTILALCTLVFQSDKFLTAIDDGAVAIL